MGCLRILSLSPLCFVSLMLAIWAAELAPVAYAVGLADEDDEGFAPASCRRVDSLSLYERCQRKPVGQ